MSNLLTLLLVLFAAVAVMVIALEKFGSPISATQEQKLSRFVLPLLAIMLVILILRELF